MVPPLTSQAPIQRGGTSAAMAAMAALCQCHAHRDSDAGGSRDLAAGDEFFFLDGDVVWSISHFFCCWRCSGYMNRNTFIFFFAESVRFEQCLSIQSRHQIWSNCNLKKSGCSDFLAFIYVYRQIIAYSFCKKTLLSAQGFSRVSYLLEECKSWTRDHDSSMYND